MKKIIYLILVSLIFIACSNESIDENVLQSEQVEKNLSKSRTKNSLNDFYTKRQLISCAVDFKNIVNPPEPDLSWINENIGTSSSQIGSNVVKYSANGGYTYNSSNDPTFMDTENLVTATGKVDTSNGQIITILMTISNRYARLKPYPLFNFVEQVPTYYNMIQYKNNFIQNNSENQYPFLDAYFDYLDCIHKGKTGYTVQEWLNAT